MKEDLHSGFDECMHVISRSETCIRALNIISPSVYAYDPARLASSMRFTGELTELTCRRLEHGDLRGGVNWVFRLRCDNNTERLGSILIYR